jgi:hypothetical protein
MKQIKMLLLVLVVFNFSHCKKKETSEPNTSTNPTQNNLDIKEGKFYTGISISKGSTLYNYVATAAFYEPSVSGTNYIDGDSVCLNGTWLHNQTSSTFYKYNSWLLPSNNMTCPVNIGMYYSWVLKGNTKFPATNFLASTQNIYLDDSYINITSISKSAGLTISHPPIAGSRIVYSISSGNGSGTIRATKTINANSTGVTFTGSELTQLPSGSGSIRIEAYNDEIIAPNSTTSFTFTNETNLTATSIPISN